jgi:holo-[acyl-carrier protein] synthase|tara:strand:+ start:151 stop:537 length:387 start_codon:yes stop_codon:yes gene_type:complete
MTILGIGTDVVENQRIKNSIKNKKFIKRVFSKKEINLSKKYKNKLNYFSKRFAAKEAFAKAIGTGIRNGLNFSDISILNDKLGKPELHMMDKLNKILKNRFKSKKIETFLSLSDEKNYSIAFVIIQKK